jgi:hypothetical protein
MLQVREKSRLFFKPYYVLETCKDMQLKYGKFNTSFLEMWEICGKFLGKSFCSDCLHSCLPFFFHQVTKKFQEKNIDDGNI